MKEKGPLQTNKCSTFALILVSLFSLLLQRERILQKDWCMFCFSSPYSFPFSPLLVDQTKENECFKSFFLLIHPIKRNTDTSELYTRGIQF